MESNVTVIIPVGPQKEYLQYLPEAIESILVQTVLPTEILLLADGVDISLDFLKGIVVKYSHAIEMFKDHFTLCPIDRNKMIMIKRWKSPWNIGFSPIFNCGVGLALYDNIVYLASDDKLMPTCIEDCVNTWNEYDQKDAWYACTYQLENGDTYTIPNNAGMITKNLWKWTKGFPPAAFAGPDALLLSCLIAHALDRIIKVEEGKPNYWIREHPYQETKRQFGYYAASGVMEIIRDMETRRFSPNEEIVLK
jgi:hypothetical protein